MFIITVFWLGSDRPSWQIFLCLLYFFPYSRLSYLICFFILFHTCCSHALVFGENIRMSSLFSIAILNGT